MSKKGCTNNQRTSPLCVKGDVLPEPPLCKEGSKGGDCKSYGFCGAFRIIGWLWRGQTIPQSDPCGAILKRRKGNAVFGHRSHHALCARSSRIAQTVGVCCL